MLEAQKMEAFEPSLENINYRKFRHQKMNDSKKNKMNNWQTWIRKDDTIQAGLDCENEIWNNNQSSFNWSISYGKVVKG